VPHGFVSYPPYRSYISFDPPGSGKTFTAVATSLSLEGTVAGTYFDANGVAHGYVRDAHGKITEFDVPGAGTGANQGTESGSISDAGEVTLAGERPPGACPK